MPRPPRDARADTIYHVFNRGAGKRTLFDRDDDYQRFGVLLRETQTRVSMRVLAFCLMPNHWHLVLWPFEGGSMSDFLHRLTTKHAQRHNRDRGLRGCGHVYQGRFKCVRVNDDQHLLTVIRYVESNPRVAGLVMRAEEWQWSSATRCPCLESIPTVDTSPVPRTSHWVELLNRD